MSPTSKLWLDVVVIVHCLFVVLSVANVDPVNSVWAPALLERQGVIS